ncbi:ATP-binding protein [Lachnospiraceae bacterium ASD3451]|uniref:ATP-binding protein n=1 Tax=Diplocloster agilis TaxID=2850323 RepID=UPI001DABEA45|nr:ATP-binding protein [Diplocloster agilis]MBU9744015.1 ATP-binding protein [Diplocloster agilis]
MVLRERYLDKLIQLRDKQLIKVVTGVRRCGKSTLLLQFQNYLKKEGVAPEQIIALNFEDIVNEELLDYHKLYDYVTARLLPDKMTYIFLDEIQAVPEFQKAVDSLFIKDKTDVYITGSNAYLLSGELATLLSGRYVEIQMLPLSFGEYFELVGGSRRDAWNAYFQNGGFPYTASIEDAAVRKDYLSGIYNTVLLKDIVARKRISDVALLESVIKFLFDNVGNVVSSKKIADSLTSYGRKTTPVTVENYIEALMESFILYKAGRYDVKGKQHLKSLEKYYLVDIGLRRLLLGDRNVDIGHLLENIVYLELLRRGYKVSIGKVENLGIDFIAESGGDRIYYQVAASVLDPGTFAREIAPLKKVNDYYPRYILSMDEIPMNEDGIKQLNIVDFLLSRTPKQSL